MDSGRWEVELKKMAATNSLTEGRPLVPINGVVFVGPH